MKNLANRVLKSEFVICNGTQQIYHDMVFPAKVCAIYACVNLLHSAQEVSNTICLKAN